MLRLPILLASLLAGFTGELQGKWYAIYGDTLWCAPGVTDSNSDSEGFHGMVRDAISQMTDDPLVVHDMHLNADTPVGHQLQFVPFNAAWGETNTYGFGGTSLVETADGAGAVFYLVNANATNDLKGAGVAKVELVNDTPTVTQRFGDTGYWWPSDTTPRYGDVAAFRDPHSGYIYAWGGAPTSVADPTGSQYVYLVRQGQSLTMFGPATAVMWFVGQGQVVWSEFFECYVFVHLSPGSGDVLLRTASSLEGPWTPDVKVYTATAIDGGLIYAGVAHPYLNSSGQTLTISYTNSNHIQVIKVTFSK
ncbi:hypothetical protein F4677DRAFT_461417 [Hypoxylon crocopeplum]|nr:hypothetical protein F4677DRAFT_461417 [Hypoxylon crocopeplum]